MTVRKAPIDVFASIVEYFPTVSLNLIVENDRGEFLFVMRGNQPVKGYWWLPGGRMLSGESIPDAARRILFEETRIDGRVEWVSPEYVTEIFEVGELDERERAIYSDDIECFHYLTIPVYLKAEGSTDVAVDSQSKQFEWSRENISTHPYIAQYFDMWRRMRGSAQAQP